MLCIVLLAPLFPSCCALWVVTCYGVADLRGGRGLASLLEYVISMPNMYARGILWGKMVLELGDSCTAKNERNGFLADITFKTKVRSNSLSNTTEGGGEGREG